MTDDIDLVTRFTEGDCWILATYLSKYTGLPVVEVREPCYRGSQGAFHWLVKPSSRTYLDVNGLQTVAEFAERWGHFRAEPIPLAWTRDWLEVKPPETYEGSWRIAPIVARRLVRQHLEAS